MPTFSVPTESQAQYMLGMRGGPSFVVGTGAGSPKQPRDRAASCPANYRTPCTATNALLPNRANAHILTGALVSEIFFCCVLHVRQKENASEIGPSARGGQSAPD